VLFLQQMWLILVGVVLVIIIIIIGEWTVVLLSDLPFVFLVDCYTSVRVFYVMGVCTEAHCRLARKQTAIAVSDWPFNHPC